MSAKYEMLDRRSMEDLKKNVSYPSNKSSGFFLDNRLTDGSEVVSRTRQRAALYP
jgi:hypothetical protein